MRKINKENTLATVFKETQKPIEYKSGSKFYIQYHKDVLVMLLYCQDALCAYTEKRLLRLSKTEIEQLFKDGEYTLTDDKGHKKKPNQVFADIEHFNSQLKKNGGWDWDNLFAVYVPVNRDIKRVEEPYFEKKCLENDWNFNDIMNLLKPDLPDYQWDRYITYDEKTHEFSAKLDLDDTLAEQIECVLVVLGINCEPIKGERIEKIELWLNQLKKGENPNITEFPTAFEFCKQILNL